MNSQMTFVYDTTSFDEPVWVVFWGMYMYGPSSTLEDVLWLIYNMWEDDRCLYG